MWPWGHAAVGYLLYSLGRRHRDQRPRSPEVFLVAVGTLLPDLVDKPLAWTLGVLDSGRSLGHSVLIAVVVLAVLYAVLAPRIGRSKVTAFGVGYLSHPLADLPFRDLLAGDLEFTTFLVWPLLPAPAYAGEHSFLAHFRQLSAFGPFDIVQLALVGIALSVWYLDGCPGLDHLRAAIGLGPAGSIEE